MTRKKMNALLGVCVLVIIGTLLIFGVLQTDDSSSEENVTGLTGSIDISPDGKRIVFSYDRNGIASIYTAAINGTNIKKLTKPENVSHINAQFSPKGNKILFLSRSKDSGNEEPKQPEQRLYIMNTDGSGMNRLSKKDVLVTDAAFSPDGETIYFLKAGVFKNYSPIASKRPHDFDIFSIKTDGGDLSQLTNLKHYSLSDLSIAKDNKKLFFTAYGTLDEPESPEASFESKETLYGMSLKNRSEITPVEVNGSFESPGVFNAQISPNGKKITFSAIAGTNEAGTYEYELFVMDRATNKAKQLTSLGSYVGESVFIPGKNKILFVEYVNWPRKPPQYKLWTINTDGSGLESVQLQFNNEAEENNE